MPTRKKTRKDYKGIIVNTFLQFLITIKLYHWNTVSYSVHNATDELYSKLNEGIDHFVEVMLGKESGSRLHLSSQTIVMRNHSSEEIKKQVDDFKRFLVGLNVNPHLKSSDNSDLFNIRDEILQNVNQFLYLLSFQ
jgi:DNA-binding ferritin-like protein